MGKRINFRQEVIKADPEWPRDNAVTEAYRFPDNRVFTEKTASSGPYRPTEEDDEGDDE